MFQSLACKIAHGNEMKAVLQTGFPIAVLIALSKTVGQLFNSIPIPDGMRRQVQNAYNAKILKADCIGQQFGFFDGGRAVRDFSDNSSRAVEESFGSIAIDGA